MRKSNLLAAVAATLMIAGTALAKEKVEGAPKEKKICKAVKTSSSRIAAKRVCRTEAEWNSAASQEELDDAAAKLRGMSRGN
ncbi:MAG: hypothetical protein ACXW27_09775 [Allosphingosinicella sp.]